MLQLTRLRAVLLLLILLVSGCDILGLEDDGLGRRDSPTLVASIQGQGLVRIDPRTGEIMARYRVVGPEEGRMSRIFKDAVRVRGPQIALGHSGGQVIGFSLTDFREEWREDPGAISARSPQTPGFLGMILRRAPSDDAALFYPVDFPHGPAGMYIGFLDPLSRSFRPAYAGPLKARAVETLPPGAVSSTGAILALGRRDGDPYLQPNWLFRIDPVTMSVVDSIPEAELPTGVNPAIMWTGQDGRHVYYRRGWDIVAYDLVTKGVSAALDVSGWFTGLSFDPLSGRFVAFDGGNFSSDYGSGVLHVFGENDERIDVDIRDSPADEILGPTVRAAAWGDDGLLYVLTGSVFTERYPRVYVIDPVDGELLEMFDLGGSWGDYPLALWYVPGR